MARTGITLAETAIELCNKFFDPNCSKTELRSTVDVMKELAIKGQTDARQVEAKFKDIHSGLLTVCISSLCDLLWDHIPEECGIHKMSHRYGILSKPDQRRAQVAKLIQLLSLSNCLRDVPGTIHIDQVSFSPMLQDIR
jgi:hypothetical protein